VRRSERWFPPRRWWIGVEREKRATGERQRRERMK
jgi:hypothetical protein